MIRKIISFLCLIMLFSGIAAFAHTAFIENSGTNQYKAIRLTPEIYKNAKSDLSDLLLKDDKGETVPYFINTSHLKIYKGSEHYPMSLINSYIKDDFFYFDYKISERQNGDIIGTSIEFTTKNTNFAKAVEVFGSYDNKFWEKVQDDTLYSVDGKTKLEILFHSPQKFTHYRLKLANNLEKIAFNSVKLNHETSTFEKSYFSESINAEFHTQEVGKQTNINIENVKHLRIEALILDTDSIFKRFVSSPLGTKKEIYNLSFNNTAYKDTQIPLNWQVSKDDALTVTIDNNDDKPINIKAITVKYFADEVVFEGKSGSVYTLQFGSSDTAKAPVYDIASYQNEILKGETDRLSIKEIKLDKVREELPQYDYKLIFNIVIILVAVLLGVLILLRLRKK